MADSFSSTLSSAGGNFGAAVSDLFASQGAGYTAAGFRLQAKGDLQAASGYTKAAGYAGENADYAVESTKIQEMQAQREATKVIGGQQSDIAGAGFDVGSGSAQYLLQSSNEQAALTQHQLATQGDINVNAYHQQQDAYLSQAQQEQTAAQVADESASAAENAGQGSMFAGIIQGAAGLAKFAPFLGL